MTLTIRGLRTGAVLVAVVLLSLALATAPSAEAASQGPRVDPRLTSQLSKLSPGDELGAFVHFDGGSSNQQRALLQGLGLEVVAEFSAVDAIFAAGPSDAIEDLFDEPSVTYVEANRNLSFFQETSRIATRSLVGEGGANGTYIDTAGNPIDGAGVGVAIVDSGIIGSHPDFAGRIAKNYKIVCSTPGLINTQTQTCFGPTLFVEATDTDTTSGHGTHVAGISSGDGSASNGDYAGVAPGSTLYGYSTGETITVLFAAEAWQHILENNDSFDVPVSVVNNSFGDGGGSEYDPDSIYVKLPNALVDSGVSVVFAAGNSGGDGSDDRLSSMAKNPKPGVITAASYNDNETGTRDGELSDFSSRGEQGDPVNYPDISAPGDTITAACFTVQPVCATGLDTTGAPYYSTISGTSMASPHVAGAVALVLQARPDLTPAQVEDVIQDTAYKFTAGGPYEADPQNSDGTTSFDKGAGLLDTSAALDALGVAKR
ncbi:MAG: S8 family serine peptidase [Actinomycetota bacterium]